MGRVGRERVERGDIEGILEGSHYLWKDLMSLVTVPR